MRSAVVTLAPDFVPLSVCDSLPTKARTAVTNPSPFTPQSAIRWDVEARVTLRDWRALESRSSTFRRFLSFSRIPFVKKLPNGDVIVGDLRYDREEGLGFSEFEISASEKESDAVGPWQSPFHAHD